MAPPSMEFSRQEYWSGLPFPSPGDLPNPGIEPGSAALRADALPSEPPGSGLNPINTWCVRACGRSNHIQLFATGSSVHGDSPDKNTGVGYHALLQQIFPTQAELMSPVSRFAGRFFTSEPLGKPQILCVYIYIN